MEGFVHIRVDDRLIHGQVATRWATGLKGYVGALRRGDPGISGGDCKPADAV